MLRELLAILRGTQLSPIGDEFAEMLRLSHKAAVKAGKIYFSGEEVDQQKRDKLHERDKRVNKLERKIRKRVLTHLAAMTNAPDLAYCLLLVSLVKDVERIGDYAKNLTEVGEFCPPPPSDNEFVAELKDIREGVEAALAAVAEVFETSDKGRATELIREGTDLARRCDTLLEKVAKSDLGAGAATSLTLGARYYKRIGGHTLNILTSVVMPLHKLDYVDENENASSDLETASAGVA